VTLTVAFEFLAGHYVFGTPWHQLVADYNIFRGRIWVLVLITSPCRRLLGLPLPPLVRQPHCAGYTAGSP